MIHYSCVHLGLPEEPQNTSSLSAHLNMLCCGNLFTVSFRKRKDCVVCITLGVYNKDVISCYELNMVIRVPCIICTLVILYLYCLMYVSPILQLSPLMSTGRPHHYGHLLQVQKESLQPLTLYISFHDLIDVYSCRSGADKPWGQTFDVNRNLLSLQSFATSFKTRGPLVLYRSPEY